MLSYCLPVTVVEVHPIDRGSDSGASDFIKLFNCRTKNMWRSRETEQTGRQRSEFKRVYSSSIEVRDSNYNFCFNRWLQSYSSDSILFLCRICTSTSSSTAVDIPNFGNRYLKYNNNLPSTNHTVQAIRDLNTSITHYTFSNITLFRM